MASLCQGTGSTAIEPALPVKTWPLNSSSSGTSPSSSPARNLCAATSTS